MGLIAAVLLGAAGPVTQMMFRLESIRYARVYLAAEEKLQLKSKMLPML